MAFTQVTVTGTYPGCSGTVTFTLTGPMQNGGEIVLPQPIVASLDSNGGLSVSLLATDDIDTQPQAVMYGVTETILGAQPRDSFIDVPSGLGSSLLLTDLLPGLNPWR